MAFGMGVSEAPEPPCDGVKQLRDRMAQLLLLCVAVRLAAWLVEPVIPLLIVSVCILSVCHFVFFGRQ